MAEEGSSTGSASEVGVATADADQGDAARLLAWYDRNRRDLPWRAPPGQRADPYAVWLSEVMLQQTTVAAVKGFFASFLARWPRVEDLAAAPAEDVMRAWAGLGYYSRARNLHACAKRVAAGGGRFPDTEAGLRALPGIGAYTAASVAAIAFDRPANVVDGNVERVIVRLCAMPMPIKLCRPAIRAQAAALTPALRPGDYAQAMMDLGATICTPRRPACGLCPLSSGCRARAEGVQDMLPAKAARPVRPERHGTVFFVRRGTDVLVRTRPPRGLLGGMTEFPGGAWRAADLPSDAVEPLAARWRNAAEPVRHGFTHFELRLFVRAASVRAGTPAPEGCRWVAESGLAGEALPTLMRKVAWAGQAALAEPAVGAAAAPVHLPFEPVP